MHRFLHTRSFFWLGVSIVFVATSCKTDYEKLVDRELRTGLRQDSLFFGLSLGMSSKDFYARCWELNKKKIIRQGYRNVSVLYVITDLKDTADMNFYPTFENDSIYEMLAYINYKGWAPWNQKLSTDTLVADVIKMLKRWYGGDFLRLDFKDGISFFVKVDRNRRIVVLRDSESQVKVVFTDMIMEQKKKRKS